MRFTLVLLISAAAFAAQSAQPTGVLTDASKGAVPQADLAVVNTATGAVRETRSNAEER